METVKFDQECKDSLIAGANLAANAIKSTFGPDGTNVIIHSAGSIHITKDGATVARAVNAGEPYQNMGVDLIKQISEKTAGDIGDGSTTAAVLAQAIINKYRDNENPIELSRKLHEDCDKVVEFLRSNMKQITGREDLAKIATLSANNDPVIGNLIADAFDRVGKDGIVNFTESEDVKDKVIYTEGFKIDNGYSAPYFVNTTKGTCELTDVMVCIFDNKVEEIKEVAEIANLAMKSKKSLLLVAPSFDSEVYIGLKNNKEILKSCCIISPNHRAYRDIMIQDMKILFGEATPVSINTNRSGYANAKNTFSFEYYHCDKVVASANGTEFICKGDPERIAQRVQEIKDTLANSSLQEFEIEFHQKRLANFTSGVATIYVGGYSPVEVRERMDRVEDAVRATKAAYEGILPGGGFALLRSAGIAGSLDSIVQVPNQLLSRNVEVPQESENFWEGYNFKTHEFGNMLEMGVVEPFLVEKTALENAVNTASLILTCNCAIVNFLDYGK